jgi:uncharacterized protein (DUF488 family)
MRNLPSNLFKVSIARYSDKFDVPKYDKLAPSGSLLYKVKNGIYNQFQYIREFNHYLTTIDPETVAEELNQMSGGKDVVLLCYESPNKFCHRQLVASWFVMHGIRCMEYGQAELTNDEWLRKMGFSEAEIRSNHICLNCDD